MASANRTTDHQAIQDRVEARGVGAAIARRITEYREREGRIGCPDDLMKIDGIDGASVDMLRKQLRA